MKAHSSAAPEATVQWETGQAVVKRSSVTPGFSAKDQPLPGFFNKDQIIPFLVSDIPFMSMSIIKPGIRTKINSILEFRKMASGGIDAQQDEAIYTNTKIQDDDKSPFERRFSFKLPPPPPIPEKGATTLERRLGTIRKVQKPMSELTPRTLLASRTLCYFMTH